MATVEVDIIKKYNRHFDVGYLYFAQFVILIFGLFLIEYLESRGDNFVSKFIFFKRTAGPIAVAISAGTSLVYIKSILTNEVSRFEGIFHLIKVTILLLIPIGILTIFGLIEFGVIAILFNLIALKFLDVNFRTGSNYSGYSIAQITLLVLFYIPFFIISFQNALIILCIFSITTICGIAAITYYHMGEGTGLDTVSLFKRSFERVPGEFFIQVLFVFPLWLVADQKSGYEYKLIAMISTYFAMAASFLKPVSLYAMDYLIKDKQYVSFVGLLILTLISGIIFFILFMVLSLMKNFLLSLDLFLLEPFLIEDNWVVLFALFCFTIYSLFRTVIDAKFSLKWISVITGLTIVLAFILDYLFLSGISNLIRSLIPYFILMGVSILTFLYLDKNQKKYHENIS